MSSKDKMVEAMSDLMWEQGFAATTPRQVRERSGVGQGSMYHHFPTKRDLGIAAIENVSDQLSNRSIAILEGEGNPLERLRAYLDTPRDPLKGCRAGRLTQDPVVARDSEMLAPIADVFARLGQALTSTIEEALLTGDLKPGLDAQQLATLMQATLQGAYVLSIASQDETPFDEALSSLRTLLSLSTKRTEPKQDRAAADTAAQEGE